jgi:hypothetical protein
LYEVLQFFLQCETASSSAWLLVTQTGTPVTKSPIPALRHNQPDGILKYMKRLYLSVAAILFLIGAFYIWGHRRDFSFLHSLLPSKTTDEFVAITHPQQLEWQPVDEATQGFKIEMPGDPQHVVVEATSETGSTEPISMLLVKPDADHSYAVAWADKPPVARMNDLVADKTLDQARDGALTRSSTTLVSEVRNSTQGFPGRDVVSHNVGGGILDTRFIYAGSRLYMLIAASPSTAGRHEEEVIRFFNSFTIASNSQIPESIPAATQ